MSVGANTSYLREHVSNLVDGVYHHGAYVYDRTDPNHPTIRLLSAASNGDPANNDSVRPQISPDGNYVVFSSTATNLVAGATSGQA